MKQCEYYWKIYEAKCIFLEYLDGPILLPHSVQQNNLTIVGFILKGKSFDAKEMETYQKEYIFLHIIQINTYIIINSIIYD